MVVVPDTTPSGVPATGLPEGKPFLSDSAALPLIGGGVRLLGQPSAADVPVTVGLLMSYKAWLVHEHRMLCHELTSHDARRARGFEDVFAYDTPGDRWHFQWVSRCPGSPPDWSVGPQPSTRAAVVLASVGCDWRTA